jgi:hypothetical protein
VIVTASGIDELNKLGRLAPGVPMAKSGVGAAVPSGAPRPDISSGEALKRALLAIDPEVPHLVGCSAGNQEERHGAGLRLQPRHRDGVGLGSNAPATARLAPSAAERGGSGVTPEI